MSCSWPSLLAAALILAPGSTFALDVPVRVESLVPTGAATLPRPAEPVSVGVPFAVEDGLIGTAGLGMSGTSAAQFRVLQRDPETDHVTWVLATFVADGGPYALTTGAGNFGGADLAVDQAGRILVSTGPARFEVKKRGFDLLDRVVLGSDEIVAPHPAGGIVVTSGGTRYESGADLASDVAIEENGPVMAVVRARGTLRDATGAASLDYTARLHFYRGQTFCRAFVTLRNADLASPMVRTFDAAWAELPLRLEAERDLLFGFPGPGFTGHLSAGGAAHLFQGDNVFQRGSHTDAIVPYLTPAAGLEVAIGGQSMRALGATTDVAGGWLRLQDSRHAVFAGMRDLATLFPSGFDVQGDRIAVEMFSRYNPRTGLVFSWGAHETREMLFEFGAAGANAEMFHGRLQYPLFGRCDFERYRDTGAICGERRLVSVAEETRFFSELGKNWRLTDLGEPDIHFHRQYSFGTTGGGNQFDQDECHLIDFLRSGFAGHFQLGRLGVLWKADQAVLHSDDFDYSTHQNGVSDVNVDQPLSFHGKGAGSLFDDEHPHWVCMPLYYHLTGDERVRDAIVDYGEHRQYRAGNPSFGALYGGALQHFRLWSRCFRDVALLYEFTGQAQYLEHVRNMSRVLLGTIEQAGSKGRNLERGYFYFGDTADPLRNIHLFFLNEMNPIGVQEAMRVLPVDDPLKEDLRDYMSGLAWFTLQEAQVVPSATGYPYEYQSATPNPPAGVRGDQTGILLTHGYETSGDAEFVRRSRALAWRVPEYQHPLRASELSEHLRIWRWLHRDEVGAALVDPQYSRNADGSYTLRWLSLPGATSYIVKYGARPLVENLGFDPVPHTFHIDPSRAMNFWAATNVQGEPAPGPPGTVETWRTPVLPAGNWNFKVKILADRPIAPLATSGLHIGDLRLPADPHADPLPGPGHGANKDAGRSAGRGGFIGVGPTLETPGTLHGAATAMRPAQLVAMSLPGGAGVRFTGLPAGMPLRVYSVAGRLVRELSGSPSGELVWDRRSSAGTRVAPGIYLYCAEAGSNRTRRGRILLAE